MGLAVNWQCACGKGMFRSGWRDLNSRPLDPQSSAMRPPKFALVRLPWSQPCPYAGELRRKAPNASQLLQSLLQRPQKGDNTKIKQRDR